MLQMIELIAEQIISLFIVANVFYWSIRWLVRYMKNDWKEQQIQEMRNRHDTDRFLS